jgi:predicted TPR repeat methyltransferase
MPTFEAAASALRPGGMLAFTVEAGTGDRYELEQKTRRYLHSKPYLQRLASMFGFEEEHFAEVVLRMNAGQPVNGFLVLLRLPLEE